MSSAVEHIHGKFYIFTIYDRLTVSHFDHMKCNQGCTTPVQRFVWSHPDNSHDVTYIRVCIMKYSSQKYMWKLLFWVITVIFGNSITNPGFLVKWNNLSWRNPCCFWVQLVLDSFSFHWYSSLILWISWAVAFLLLCGEWTPFILCNICGWEHWLVEWLYLLGTICLKLGPSLEDSSHVTAILISFEK